MTKSLFFICMLFCKSFSVHAQTNFLLNGNFEDINTCNEFNAECGVEAWFYMKDVKVQMIRNDTDTALLGFHTFTIFNSWNGFKDFTPIIGTILPCHLQKGKQYIFKGMIAAQLHPRLILKPGICLGVNFFVPRRPFSKELKPDSIVQIKRIPETSFMQFEYSFIANGDERYLTFGTYVSKDSAGGTKNLLGAQTVTLRLDNFSLTSADSLEEVCPAFANNKQRIYGYNFRHKEMDYSLYGKGKLPVELSTQMDDNETRHFIPPPKPVQPDTLKLGDVLFDFNKADLKPEAITMLNAYFMNKEDERKIDSIHIEGFTDSVGSDAKNIRLSQQRSESVGQWINAKLLLSNDKIAIHAFGKTRPVASNKTPAGRALNRRVEVLVFRHEGR